MSEIEKTLERLNRLQYLAAWWRREAFLVEPTRMMVCIRHSNALGALVAKIRMEVFG